MRTKLIALVFVISGIFVGFKGAGNITGYAHLHEPGNFLYDSEIMNAIIDGDLKKEEELKEDRDRAQKHIQRIIDATLGTNFTLVVIGGINVFFGLLLYPRKTKKVDPVDCDQ